MCEVRRFRWRDHNSEGLPNYIPVYHPCAPLVSQSSQSGYLFVWKTPVIRIRTRSRAPWRGSGGLAGASNGGNRVTGALEITNGRSEPASGKQLSGNRRTNLTNQSRKSGPDRSGGSADVGARGLPGSARSGTSGSASRHTSGRFGRGPSGSAGGGASGSASRETSGSAGRRRSGPTGPDPARPAGLKAARINPWILAGILAAVAIAATFDPRLYINGDNVDYMFLARAARHGQLWSSDKYPPLFPLLLAAVQLVAGMRLIPQKLLVLVLSIGSILLLMRIVRRRCDGRSGPWVLWIAATLIPVVEYSHYTMSEIPYLFFLLGAVDAFDRLFEGGLSIPEATGAKGEWPAQREGTAHPESSFREALQSRRMWWLALWIGAAFYTRSAGAALAVGILASLWFFRRRRDSGALVVCLAVLGLPWLVRSLATPGGNPYLRQLLLVNPYYPEFGRLTAASFFRRLSQNARFYFVQEIPSTVFPAIYHSTYTAPGYAFLPAFISIPLLVPLAIGLGKGLRRADPVATVTALTLVLCCLWPLIWTGSRFLVPVVPLLSLLWWKGWGGLGPQESSPRRSWMWTRRIVLGLLVILSARNLYFYKDETGAYPPVWDHYFQALHWIGAETPADAVVVDRKPGFVEFVAGRRAISFPREKDPDRMIQFFREHGATHVVLPSLPYDDIGRYLQPALDQRQDFFNIVFQLRDPFTYVLEFRPEGGVAHDGSPSGQP